MAIPRAAVSDARGLLRWSEERTSDMVSLVRELVTRESPSSDKPSVDALVDYVAQEFERAGGRIRFHKQREFGNLLQADFGPRNGRGRLLLLGHLDTVYELGTLASMPWREERGRIYGPGVFDMKCGVVTMLYALRALRELRGEIPRAITVLLNSDEEIGSPASRPVTEKLAKQCDAVLVFEPAAGPKGACKTSRKGVGLYTIKVTGRAAHAGLDFQKGASAIIELARQLVETSKFTDLKRGTTVNAGVISGGTRTNVIAESAEARIDVRVTSAKEARELDRKFRKLRPFDRNCRIEVMGGLNRAPFERSKATAALYAHARELASELGFALDEVGVGGGSDGNFTAALGIPTLDGLGAVGEGAHATHEHVVIAEIPRRTALAARMLET